MALVLPMIEGDDRHPTYDEVSVAEVLDDPALFALCFVIVLGDGCYGSSWPLDLSRGGASLTVVGVTLKFHGTPIVGKVPFDVCSSRSI